ncbi:MAG: hypothetical protein AAFR81_01795 [Chloroflexota bacterium]
MYRLKNEVLSIENTSLELKYFVGTAWLKEKQLILRFFTTWSEVQMYFRVTGYSYIHPLLLYIHRDFVKNITTTLNDSNLSDLEIKALERHRDELEDIMDDILEHATSNARVMESIEDHRIDDEAAIRQEIKQSSNFHRRGFLDNDFFEEDD